MPVIPLKCSLAALCLPLKHYMVKHIDIKFSHLAGFYNTLKIISLLLLLVLLLLDISVLCLWLQNIFFKGLIISCTFLFICSAEQC